MYQALYRKWRPRTFDDVCGQTHITDALKRQITSGRQSHAYLFVGTRGTGKTSCAKILSRAVNCERPEDGNPCNTCPACVGIENGSILDVLEIDAASNNGVDNVRALREEAVFTPAAVRKRVYIIDEVHMLSTAAFNALLKILEEPPAHLVFILATTDVHKIPATILSRCQRFSFRRIGPEVIAARLTAVSKAEGFSLQPEAAEVLARRADGSMRDALSLLDRCSALGDITLAGVQEAIGLSSSREIAALLAACAGGDTARALDLLATLYADGKSMPAVLDELIALERDVLISIVSGPGAAALSGGFDGDTVHRLAGLFTPEKLISDIDLLRAAAGRIGRSDSGRLAVELCLIQMCNEALSDSCAALGSRIARLERQLARGIPHAPAQAAPPQAPTAPSSAQGTPEIKNTAAETPPWEDAPPQREAQAPIQAPAPPAPQERDTAPVAPAGENHHDVWQAVLAALEKDLGVHIFSLLSDKNHCQAQLDGNVLTLQVGNDFAYNMINTTDVTGRIKGETERVTGGPVMVKLTQDAGHAADAAARLDALSRFGNIKFE